MHASKDMCKKRKDFSTCVLPRASNHKIYFEHELTFNYLRSPVTNIKYRPIIQSFLQRIQIVMH